MGIFNFVNVENIIYMKLYSLLILNKKQQNKKKNVKTPKKTKLAVFPRRILSCKQDVLHIRPKILTAWAKWPPGCINYPLLELFF